MGRLIVISQRAPRPDPSKDAGGLVVALRSTLEAEGGLWIGIAGETTQMVGETLEWQDAGGLRIGQLTLSHSEHAGQYLGFANGTLWPVFHNRIDLSRYSSAEFATYTAVAERLARLVAQELRSGDTVWIHDYQMIPVARALRALGVTAKIGFFLHIPWPSVDSFHTIPQHRQVIEDMAAYDVIGLQAQRDLRNFSNCAVASGVGEWLPNGRFRIAGNAVTLGHFPISIDVEEFAALAQSTKGQTPRAYELIGVERLDYSKGLPQRFLAFQRFLEKNEDAHGHVRFLQIAPPSRSKLEAYRDISDELDRRAGHVNGRFGSTDWVPMHYISQTVPRPDVARLLAEAQVGIVTPLMDGMNLVAKEFIAAQDEDDPGVLVLSQFAGAAEELDAALIVNPYDVEALADAMGRALSMSLDERRERHRHNYERLRSATIHDWAASFLNVLRPGHGSQDPASSPLSG
ncbi:MAG: trehalose-6-phosphate synthase [Pseudomonadota bacterium]